MERALFVHERLMLPSDRTYNAVIALRLRGREDAAALRVGLGRLQDRHPLLRAGIDLAGRRPRFVRMRPDRPIPVRVVPDGGETDWLSAVRAEIDHPFPLEAGPLARVVWIERGGGADLVLVVHHAIADGIAMLAMLEVLVGWLGGAEASREAPPAIASIGSLVSTGAGAKRSVRLREAAIVAGTAGLGRLFGRAVGASRLWRRARPLVASRIDFFAFDEALTRRLERRARRERVTVYALLATVFLRVLREQRPGRALNRLVCPVDVRHQFDLRHPELLFPTPVAVPLRLARRLDGDPWGQARALNEILSRRRRALRVRFWLPALERLHGVVGGMVEGQLRARRTVDLSYAHLGSVEFDAPGADAPIAFERALGATASMPWSDTMLITSLRSAGRLRFCVSTDDGKLPPAEAEAFFDAVVAMVADVAGAE